MRKVVLLLIALLIFAFAPKTNAQDFQTKSARSGKVVVLEKDEVIDKDYFVWGEQVEILGTINGDLYVAGGQVDISGTVNGDLLAAGGTIALNGNILQDARVVGGQLSINGTINKNLTAVGGNINIDSAAQIFGSLVGAGGNFTIASPIAKNITLGAGNLTIANTINGDVEAGFGNATLTSNAKIFGDFDYWSENEANISKEATVTGRVTKNDVGKVFDQKEFQQGKKGLVKIRKAVIYPLKIISLLSSLVVGLLFVFLFPKYLEKAVKTLENNPLKSLGVGLLVLLLTPFTFILLLVTIIGIPIAFILLVFYLIYIYLSKLVIMLFAGLLVTKRFDKKASLYWSFVFGLVIYAILSFIPVVRVFVAIFTVIFGLGALVQTCKQIHLLARKKGIW